MIRQSLSVLTLLVLPEMVSATAPSTSLRPDLRPGSQPVAAVSLPMGVAVPTSVLPPPRPGIARPTQATPPTVVPVTVTPQPELLTATISLSAIGNSLRPKKRPKVPKKFLNRISARGTTTATAAGSVCGDNAIKGTRVKAIPGRLRGCGIAQPVRLTSVAGVALRGSPTINCTAAKALKKWVSQSVKPAVGNMGGGVASLRVVAGFSCRTRNNQPGAKVSEHGRGNAIDIAAINLRNGVTLSVLKGWRDKTQGRILKKVHKQACGTFGTVLGPNSDRFHQDHFHFDVARHRGGAYCR